MTYNAAGQITSETLGNGETLTYTYDKRLRLQAMNASRSGTTLYSFNLTFAPDGDVAASPDSANGNWTYTYDQFSRLSGSNQNSGQAVYTYDYDRFGDRWHQNGPHSMQLSFSGDNNRPDGYSYDAAGNLMSDGTHTYTYDAENRIVAVDAGATATYVYDANGYRVRQTGYHSDTCSPNDGIRDFGYNIFGQQTQEHNSGGTGCRQEVYAGGRHLATYAGTAEFVHTDWLGNERFRKWYNPDKPSYTESCTNLPFGDALSCSGGDPSPMHFTGKERDSESGLDNFDFRYFSSSLGRFMKPDDTEAVNSLGNPQGLNLYSYVQNNPTNAVDPDGHDCIYINNDTGKYEGFNSGDCDNSTEDKANTGRYVDGTVNTITTTTGDANGVVTGYSGTSDAGTLLSGTFSTPLNNTPSDALNANAVAIFSDINRRNIIGNTFKIYGAGALIGATGGAACYYLCPAATVTTLGLATSPLLPIVPSALEKLQRLGMSLQEATAIVESPTSQKLVDNLPPCQHR